MSHHLMAKSLTGLCSGGILAIAAWMVFVDPRLENWGAQAGELSSALPGDHWVDVPGQQRTRAITIHAPPARVWPWLVQLGAGRGGFYTFSLIERSRTHDHSPMRHIEPALQSLALGDRVALATGLELTVISFEPDRALVLGSPDPEPHTWSWAFVLVPDPQGSRLIVRERYAPVDALPLRALNRAVASLDNLMSWKMLQGIKQRVEGGNT
ncbi:MAG: hypothetical protein CVV27_04025 [Candidatus Melainabacteria bacterium HGW-Melainabacteria-1]|nr:MAG: hypothetical protein CVV27_04025 [Candidatus Melainabacteria bacterium HGW-Melainabacteria-1]